MQVAITGASGFIGAALVRSLEADGHTAVGFTRRGGPGIAWDPAQGSIDAASLEGIDAVVHLAGEGIAEKRWSADQKAKILDSRVNGTRLLASTLAGLNRPPAILLSGSAVGYYGNRGDDVLTETAEPGHDFLAEVCVAWEAETAAASEAGIVVAHLRTGVVLDREGGMLRRILPLFKFAMGGRLGSGRQYMSWISLADEIGAIRWLLDNPSAGAFNLTAPEPVTNREFTSALGGAVHRPAVVPVPRFAPKLLLGAELAAGLLFTSTRAVPRALLDGGYVFSHDTIDEALAVSGGPTSPR